MSFTGCLIITNLLELLGLRTRWAHHLILCIYWTRTTASLFAHLGTPARRAYEIPRLNSKWATMLDAVCFWRTHQVLFSPFVQLIFNPKLTCCALNTCACAVPAGVAQRRYATDDEWGHPSRSYRLTHAVLRWASIDLSGCERSSHCFFSFCQFVLCFFSLDENTIFVYMDLSGTPTSKVDSFSLFI